MKPKTWKAVSTEAKLLLIGIPVLLWTMLPIYHLFLFAISPKESAFAGKLWPDHPTLHNFEVVFRQQQEAAERDQIAHRHLVRQLQAVSAGHRHLALL